MRQFCFARSSSRVFARCEIHMNDCRPHSDNLGMIAAVSSSICRHVIMYVGNEGLFQTASHIVWLDIPMHDAL